MTLMLKYFRASIAISVISYFSNLSASGASSDAEISISSIGNDISFDKKEIKVPYKKKISISFKNLALKNSGIQHNIVILKPGKMDEFIKELQKNQYDLAKLKSSQLVVSYSAVLEPEMSDSISFEPKAGALYPFLCTMPGHGDMLNMRGTIQVTDSKK
jgi:azurin